MSNPDPPVPDAVPALLQLLGSAAFRRSFLSDPQAALTANDLDGVPWEVVESLAELTYEELRAVGTVGADLRAVFPNGLIF